MHFGSPSDPSQTAAAEAKPRYVYSILKPHGQSSRSPVRPRAAEQSEAELDIPDFKTTWSEFQNPSQTAAERGKAELRILDFKTTWSEFQKPSQTAAE